MDVLFDVIAATLPTQDGRAETARSQSNSNLCGSTDGGRSGGIGGRGVDGHVGDREGIGIDPSGEIQGIHLGRCDDLPHENGDVMGENRHHLPDKMRTKGGKLFLIS